MKNHLLTKLVFDMTNLNQINEPFFLPEITSGFIERLNLMIKYRLNTTRILSFFVKKEIFKGIDQQCQPDKTETDKFFSIKIFLEQENTKEKLRCGCDILNKSQGTVWDFPGTIGKKS